MAYADLTDLFMSNDYHLPYIEADDTRTFLHRFSDKMHRYIADLEGIDELAFKTMDKDTVVADLRLLFDELKEVLTFYLNGYPAKAYAKFKKLLEDDDLYQQLNYNRLLQVDDNTAFYRSKKIHDKKQKGLVNRFIKTVAATDMFHVPFEKRKSIGTNRYSIPGFPCIYLSDHLQTSWSECMSSDKEPFYAVCYRNHRPLYLVDLVPLNVIIAVNHGKVPDGMFSSMNPEQALINYTKVFPIIYACHSKITYSEEYAGEVKFKSEYIIPQLLMQWYRDQKLLVDGIRYLSCTAEAKFKGSTFNKFNFVVPVDICEEVGLCPSLLVNFSGSAVYAYRRPTGKTLDVTLQDIQSALNTAKARPLV